MTLQPFLNAPAIIQVHAATALTALVLGTVQLAMRKGGKRHRILGWGWAALLTTVALTSIWISRERMSLGPFSWIHLLSVLTLVMLPLGLLAARRRRVSAHARIMVSLFAGALVIAGLFTLLPYRILGRVVSGG